MLKKVRYNHAYHCNDNNIKDKISSYNNYVILYSYTITLLFLTY